MVTHLEHLDVRHAEIEIGRVAKDEGCAKEQAYGEDRSQEHLL